MEHILKPDPFFNNQNSLWREQDFHSIILDVLQNSTSNDNIAQPAKEDEHSSALLNRVLRAAKRFGEGAALLSKAFLWSAATGQPIVRGEVSPLASRLHKEIKELMTQLHWLEQPADTASNDVIDTPQSLWAAQTLATAVRLKILQRAASYCRLCGETAESSPRVIRIQQLHRYYLDLLSKLQYPPQS